MKTDIKNTSDLLKTAILGVGSQLASLRITVMFFKFIESDHSLQIEDSYRFKFAIENSIKELEEILKSLKEINVK